MITIHVLQHGFPLCRFSGKVPGQWPLGSIWIRREEYEATAAACADPEHELHAIARYAMCSGCERAIENPPPPDPPIVPTEGRTCEHCKAPLVSTWPAVYCSNECAFADVGYAPGTACVCSQHGDLECPIHPHCECGCPAHAHRISVASSECVAGRIECRCERYRPRGDS